MGGISTCHYYERGIGNPNPVKLGRCIKELERIYGVREGSAGKAEPKVSDGNVTYQSDIADMIGISVDTLQNYKKLTEMIPELEELVDTGSMQKMILDWRNELLQTVRQNFI